ncbi:hypothetical protein E2C01_070644 [Portunus trituberculatus]|uniref:Uncharacterized protein n=1 Tax=Portunus trituberculatus TaxID=210409 RepID=A0A5B7I5T7_PORTR|nr:hypothetical protein [Portunus trituberculatus]
MSWQRGSVSLPLSELSPIGRLVEAWSARRELSDVDAAPELATAGTRAGDEGKYGQCSTFSSASSSLRARSIRTSAEVVGPVYSIAEAGSIHSDVNSEAGMMEQ